MSEIISSPAKSRRSRELDLLAVGELLADFISHEVCENLEYASDFHRYQGGSPANLASNMARLGNNAALIACLGKDNLGRYLKTEIAATGVIPDYVVADSDQPTTIVLLTKTSGTPDFIAYRAADTMIQREHIAEEVIGRSTLYHTTCFALSRQPAQSSILDGARRAADKGCQLSIDTNYAPSIWPDRDHASKVIAEYCSYGTLAKISLDDIARLFDDETVTAEEAIARFHSWGATLVCLTKGSEGSVVSWDNGSNQKHVPSREVAVADATGAGDAYWAGFLTAWLDGYEPPDCAVAGSNLAAIKLQIVGPLPQNIERSKIYPPVS